MDVHLGKFLIMACIFNCLDAALTITVSEIGLAARSSHLTLRCTGYVERKVAVADAIRSRIRSGRRQTWLQSREQRFLDHV